MRRGLTLIELLIVMTIMTILLAGGFVFYGGKIDSARVSKTMSVIERIKNVTANYYSDTGGFPSSTKQYWNNAAGVSGWYGPYIDAPNGDSGLDYFPHMPWGGIAKVECSPGNYFRFSMQRISQDICQKLDEKMDDGASSSGRIRWENLNCNYYIREGASVRCK